MDMSAIKDIEQKILALPIEQRAQLAESLLESLPPVGNESSEAEELAEVERREKEIESGATQPVPDNQFWKQVEARRKR